MLKTVAGLLPIAAGLAVFAAAVWLLLARDIGLGEWLLAAFLVGHGLVHVMFLVPSQPDTTVATNAVANPFDMAKAWPVRVGLDVGVVRQLTVALITFIVVGYGLAGLATVGILVPAGWWQTLVIGSTAASFVLLAAFLSPGLLLGFAINAVLLWIVLASIWAPGGVARAAIV